MMSALRIAWIVYGSLDQISGAYIYDRLVVEELRRLGDEVTIISLEPGAAPPELSSRDFDVIVGDEACFRELVPLFRRGASPRRVLLIHHLAAWEQPPGDERARLLELEKAAIDAADACVATSPMTADRLRAEAVTRPLYVAEPGADRLPRPASAGQEPSGVHVRLLFLGNLIRRKRVLELCAAFAGLPTAAAELVLAGGELEPEYAQLVRKLAQEAGVSERVRFLGPLPAEQVAEQLALCDALVLPSALEGYGMVLSEALWASVPVIAARVGAAEQLVNQTGAGLLFEPADQLALGAALSRFVLDSALRAQPRKAACRAEALLPKWRDTAGKLRATLTP